ncbi:MAG: hypothetical protein VR64_22445 [Desulfatitalea sp. BRH_c12]|nr:MAG: hypothetical protein VR64_22445 [Desulfatitalea sp. BRH_c12]
MSAPTIFALSAVTQRIQQILQPAIGKTFWVKAEISSGRERGGSFYCDLVETNAQGKIIAQIKCTIWSRDLIAIRKRYSCRSAHPNHRLRRPGDQHGRTDRRNVK